MSAQTNPTRPAGPGGDSTSGSGAGSGGLPKQFVPVDHEPRVRQAWESARIGAATAPPVLSGAAKPYAIFIPPPNVTDRLHLGHALNNTLQDVLVRAHRMMGFETLWMPGTDHAGIATQTVVEKRLKREEGKSRQAYGREAFVAKVQAFKDEYEAAITGQLRAMGCSCDWDRQRFTMDVPCTRAVREAFFRLFRDRLLYRGKRLVNWDPVTQTALADDEVEMEEVDGFFYYLRYPLVKVDANGRHIPVTWDDLAARGYAGAKAATDKLAEQAWVTVATTRPETYLGDTAVALNPRDARAAALRGLMVHLPLVGRVIPIIEDDYVVMPLAPGANPDADGVDPKAKFATGFLKVTPAHDPNDYDIGLRHRLPLINVMAPDASISDKHGWTDVGGAEVFVGMPREIARREVIGQFSRRGLLEAQKPYRHGVGHSYRSHAPIEPYLSDQWYVRVTDARLAGAALQAMAPDQRTGPFAGSVAGTSGGAASSTGTGELRFYPERYAKSYQTWHENIRDWCISRQLWWGHRIPVWSLIPNVALIKKGEILDDSEYVEKQFLDGLEAACHAFFEAAGVAADIALQRESARQWWVCPRTDAAAAALAALERAFADRLTTDAGALGAAVRDALATAGLAHCAPQACAVVPSLLFFEQEQDVLDTWFSSGLWPLSTLGWPEHTDMLRAFNPSAVLCTAREIITLWVSRMVMFNRYFRGQDSGGPASAGRGVLPFKDVFIHAMIQDEQGRKMSKSLGNGVDPLDIIASHGADAMRFTLCQMTTNTQDVRMPVDVVCPHCGHVFSPGWAASTTSKAKADAEGMMNVPDQACPACTKGMVTLYGVFSGISPATAERPQARNTSSKFDLGRNFANKLWNAARFASSMLAGGRSGGGVPSTDAGLAAIDRWMLSRLAGATAACEAALKGYEFSVYAQTLYDLVWRDFCDCYLEAIKPTVAGSACQQGVLRAALEGVIRLAHPVMPFVTEAIDEALRSMPSGVKPPGVTMSEAALLCRAGWPRLDPSCRDAALEARVERARGLIAAVNQARSVRGIPPKRRVVMHVDAAPGLKGMLDELGTVVSALAGLSAVKTEAPSGTEATLTVPFEAAELRLSDLADAADAGADCDRLVEQLVERQRDVMRLQTRLESPGYAQRAPAHLVEQSKSQLATKTAERDALLGTLKSAAEQASARLAARLAGAEAQLASLAPELPDAANPPKQLTAAQKRAKDQAAAATEDRDAARWVMARVK